MTNVTYAPMTLLDYEGVATLWRATEGLCLVEADEFEGISQYLSRNPDFSQIARCDEQIIGVALCGHDGRVGMIHHLAVAKEYRGQGIAGEIVRRCLQALRKADINDCYAMVLVDNEPGINFWNNVGFRHRDDHLVMHFGTACSTGCE